MTLLTQLKLNICVLTLLVFPLVAKADYKSEIIASCTNYQLGKDSSEINACKLYIDGFIDSSILTDDGAIKPKAIIEQNANEQSQFLKRAYQTRVLTTSSVNQDDEMHQFCIPKEYDRKEIASSLAKSLDIKQLDEKLLKEVLFDTLVTNFPCNY